MESATIHAKAVSLHRRSDVRVERGTSPEGKGKDGDEGKDEEIDEDKDRNEVKNDDQSIVQDNHHIARKCE